MKRLKNILYIILIFSFQLFSLFSKGEEEKVFAFDNLQIICVLDIEKKEYTKIEPKLHDNLKNIWNISYTETSQKVIFNLNDKNLNESEKKKSGDFLNEILKSALERDIDLNWGYSLDKTNERFLFLTNDIYLLFKKGTSFEKAIALLEKYPFITIKPITKEMQSNWKELPVISGCFQDTDTDTMLKVCIDLQNFDSVKIVTLDYDLLVRSEDIAPASTGGPPPDLDQYAANNLVIHNNYIHRAWQLLYPSMNHFDNYDSTKFFCSKENVALFDYNFLPHNYIRYKKIGYDGFDEDYNAIEPNIQPEYNDQGYMLNMTDYYHGSHMAGAIGGHYQQYRGYYIGIAPGTYIVPFRPSVLDEIDLTNAETRSVWCDKYAGGWINSLFRLSVLSRSESVKIANYSGTVNVHGYLPFIENDMYTRLGSWFDSIINNNGSTAQIFFSCSAGNTENINSIAFPASLDSTFAVGTADFGNDIMLGNFGWNLDLVVDDGSFSQYRHFSADSEDRVILGGNGGSSLASAVVSGVAALVQSFGFNAEQIKYILRKSARHSPVQLAFSDANGYTPYYGYGFLDAYHAVKIAYKQYLKPISAQKARYLPDGTSSIVIQTASVTDKYGIAPKGLFWSLKQTKDSQGDYWQHLRHDENAQIADIELVNTRITMGDIFLTGDFDGDSFDEIALQCGNWDDMTEYHFLVRKYSSVNNEWVNLGQPLSYPGQAQLKLPENKRIDQVITFKNQNLNQDILVSRQGNQINTFYFNAPINKWDKMAQINYSPKLNPGSSAISNNIINRNFVFKELISIKEIFLSNYFNGLLVIGLCETRNRNTPYYYLTASILVLNKDNKWQNLILDIEKENTHALLYEGFEKISINSININNFADTDEIGSEAVLEITKNKENLLLMFDPDIVGFIPDKFSKFNSMPVFSVKTFIAKAPMNSKVHHGDIDNDKVAELVYINKDNPEFHLVFYSWDQIQTNWVNENEFKYVKKGNSIEDILVGDFNSDGYSEIGLLLTEPYTNIFQIYQMNQYGEFTDYGLW